MIGSAEQWYDTYEEAVELYMDQNLSGAEALLRECTDSIAVLIADERPIQHARVLSVLSAVYRGMNRTSDSLETIKRAVALVGESAGEASQEFANIVRNAADLHYQAERFDEAEALYRRALYTMEALVGSTIHPELWECHYAMSLLAEARGVEAAAEQHFERAFDSAALDTSGEAIAELCARHVQRMVDAGAQANSVSLLERALKTMIQIYCQPPQEFPAEAPMEEAMSHFFSPTYHYQIEYQQYDIEPRPLRFIRQLLGMALKENEEFERAIEQFKLVDENDQRARRLGKGDRYPVEMHLDSPERFELDEDDPPLFLDEEEDDEIDPEDVNWDDVMKSVGSVLSNIDELEDDEEWEDEGEDEAEWADDDEFAPLEKPAEANLEDLAPTTTRGDFHMHYGVSLHMLGQKTGIAQYLHEAAGHYACAEANFRRLLPSDSPLLAAIEENKRHLENDLKQLEG
ncbi:tetratricopeptide repeat protein [bacterium]|nr:tetratricopeptide repeat protein [bacterium]